MNDAVWKYDEDFLKLGSACWILNIFALIFSFGVFPLETPSPQEGVPYISQVTPVALSENLVSEAPRAPRGPKVIVTIINLALWSIYEILKTSKFIYFFYKNL